MQIGEGCMHAALGASVRIIHPQTPPRLAVIVMEFIVFTPEWHIIQAMTIKMMQCAFYNVNPTATTAIKFCYTSLDGGEIFSCRVVSQSFTFKAQFLQLYGLFKCAPTSIAPGAEMDMYLHTRLVAIILFMLKSPLFSNNANCVLQHGGGELLFIVSRLVPPVFH
jgi:hypothetical protein